MKRAAALLPVFLMLSLGSARAMERPEIQFDKRTWKVGHQAAKENQITVEFVLENESVDRWSELVTTQLFTGLQDRMTVQDYVKAMKESITERCPGVEWKGVRVSLRDAVYEWNVSGCRGVPDQSEIARVIKGDEAIHVLHYATNKPKMPADKRKEWLGLLERARLIS